MKSFLLIAIFFSPFFLFSQTITYDTSKTWNGHLYWTGEHHRNGFGEKSWDRWIFYYENGQKRLEEFTDTLFVSHKLVNGWLPDGTQILKNGNGIFLELGKDSTIFQVQDSIYEGYCKSYRRFATRWLTWEKTPWKLYATGNFSDGLKNGEWIYKDSSGANTVSFNYEDGIVRGKCTLYYSVAQKIKETGTIENCLKTGYWKSYDSLGNLLVECYYENGEKKGEYISYYPNGKIKSKGQYTHSTKRFKIPVEDPKHPGDFNYIHIKIKLTNVPAKNGLWYFYNDNGELLNSKRYHNKKEVPEYLEPINWRRHHFYYRSDIPFSAIPDCYFL